MADDPIWTPGPERVERAQITRFAAFAGRRAGRTFADYEELWSWSVEDLEGFWSAVVDFLDLDIDSPDGRVLGRRDMPGAEWWPAATTSYAAHLGRNRGDDEVAIHHRSEVRPLGQVTWGELRAQAGAIAGALRGHGVARGDRVAAYLPNIPETIAAFWACASIGAVWSSAAPEFGAQSVLDRFSQIEPKVLLAVDGYRYGGRDFDRTDVVTRLRDELATVETTVVLAYLDPRASVAGTVAWDDFLADGAGQALRCEPLPFDHPLWILYSSGTTGLPKPIVQSQGGILVTHAEHLHLQVDARAGDRVFWYTTTGWMMWNFLVGALLTDAAVVLFDGNPAYPSLDTLWDLAEQAGITTFGTSAGYLATCLKEGVHPRRPGRELTRLASVGSTGSPLSPEAFGWVYDELGPDIWLFSTSGGTDVCTSVVAGAPTLPVHIGELQARALGCAVESWSPDGKPLADELGELVITRPMPSMPIGFWGDADGSRYRDAYFAVYPGIWRHGDWIRITPRHTAVITGRSDSTINRGGVRTGTAEIYRAVLAEDDIVDALVVDVPRPGSEGGWMPLFVVLRDGATLDDALIGRLRARLRRDVSPRHVPDAVVAIDRVPRTLSGKVLEIPVKRILMGEDPAAAASRESLQDPAALDWFVDFARTLAG